MKEIPGNGRPSLPPERQNKIVSFLELPDISYCMLGHKDKIYCGKVEGEKVYKSRQYLLWTLLETVELFNQENTDFKLTYYQLQKIIKDEKHLILMGGAKEDDCRCERCENLELLLTTIKKALLKAGREGVAAKFSIDSIDFVSSLVCSLKNFN